MNVADYQAVAAAAMKRGLSRFQASELVLDVATAQGCEPTCAHCGALVHVTAEYVGYGAHCDTYDGAPDAGTNPCDYAAHGMTPEEALRDFQEAYAS